MKTEENNKTMWMLYVANRLGFDIMPPNLLQDAETLYDKGYLAFQAVDYLKSITST